MKPGTYPRVVRCSCGDCYLCRHREQIRGLRKFRKEVQTMQFCRENYGPQDYTSSLDPYYWRYLKDPYVDPIPSEGCDELEIRHRFGQMG